MRALREGARLWACHRGVWQRARPPPTACMESSAKKRKARRQPLVLDDEIEGDDDFQSVKATRSSVCPDTGSAAPRCLPAPRSCTLSPVSHACSLCCPQRRGHR